MNRIMGNGSSALLAFQQALATTSQNIANVNTSGYSKQRVDLEAIAVDPHLRNQSGQGVRITGVERLHDLYATRQLLETSSGYARQSTHLDLASRIDSFMAEDALSITPALNDFYNAIQDANSDPASQATRQVVLDQASALTQRFNRLQSSFDELQQEVNDRKTLAISDINEIAESIANLNQRIVSAKGIMQGGLPNELMDQRDTLINELSALTQVRTLDQEDGAVNVFIGNGIALVANTGTQLLRVKSDAVMPNQLAIEVGRNNNWQDISNHMEGGSIAGIQDFERETLTSSAHQLGRMALVFADEINSQHGKGIDLQGLPGGEFFKSGSPVVNTSTENLSGATLSASITDTKALKASDYLIRFTGTNYNATRLSDGQQFNSASPLNIDGLSISASGPAATAGDTFLVSATGRAAAYIDNAMQDPGGIALSEPLRTNSAMGNLGDSRISAAKHSTQLTRHSPIGSISFLPATAPTMSLIQCPVLRWPQTPATSQTQRYNTTVGKFLWRVRQSQAIPIPLSQQQQQARQITTGLHYWLCSLRLS